MPTRPSSGPTEDRIKACDPCNRAKVKCLREEGDERCYRCTRSNLECRKIRPYYSRKYTANKLLPELLDELKELRYQVRELRLENERLKSRPGSRTHSGSSAEEGNESESGSEGGGRGRGASRARSRSTSRAGSRSSESSRGHEMNLEHELGRLSVENHTLLEEVRDLKQEKREADQALKKAVEIAKGVLDQTGYGYGQRELEELDRQVEMGKERAEERERERTREMSEFNGADFDDWVHQYMAEVDLNNDNHHPYDFGQFDYHQHEHGHLQLPEHDHLYQNHEGFIFDPSHYQMQMDEMASGRSSDGRRRVRDGEWRMRRERAARSFSDERA